MALIYTTTTHHAPYPAISPSLPQLSAATKTVFIAGGSAGIGRASAFAFMAAGCRRLALTGRRTDVLSSTAVELTSAYPDAQVLTFAVDILDAAGMNDALATVKEKFGAADVVINCSSYLPSLKPIASAPLDEWWSGFEVNVKGAAVLAQAVAQHASSTATLLQLSTAGALFPANGAMPMSGYAASKLAVVKVMEYFGAENPDLRVISVHPGVIVGTEMGKRMGEETGVQWEGDDIKLPAQFLVWAASDEAMFLKNKFVFAGWDVEEMKARKDDIGNSSELILGLNGFPRDTAENVHDA